LVPPRSPGVRSPSAAAGQLDRDAREPSASAGDDGLPRLHRRPHHGCSGRLNGPRGQDLHPRDADRCPPGARRPPHHPMSPRGSFGLESALRCEGMGENTTGAESADNFGCFSAIGERGKWVSGRKGGERSHLCASGSPLPASPTRGEVKGASGMRHHPHPGASLCSVQAIPRGIVWPTAEGHLLPSREKGDTPASSLAHVVIPGLTRDPFHRLREGGLGPCFRRDDRWWWATFFVLLTKPSWACRRQLEFRFSSDGGRQRSYLSRAISHPPSRRRRKCCHRSALLAGLMGMEPMDRRPRCIVRAGTVV
jgi:hypothetical protein